MQEILRADELDEPVVMRPEGGSEHDADAAQHVEDEYVEALDAVAQQVAA